MGNNRIKCPDCINGRVEVLKDDGIIRTYHCGLCHGFGYIDGDGKPCILTTTQKLIITLGAAFLACVWLALVLAMSQ